MKRLIALLIPVLIAFVLSAQVNQFGTPVSGSYCMQNIGAADYNWTVTKDKFGAIYFGNDDNIVIRYRIEIRSCNNLNKVNI